MWKAVVNPICHTDPIIVTHMSYNTYIVHNCTSLLHTGHLLIVCSMPYLDVSQVYGTGPGPT